MDILNDNEVTELLKVPLVLSTAWQNVGEVFNIGDLTQLSIWANIDINDSTDLQFKVVGLKTKTASEEYELPISLVTETLVKVNPQVFQIYPDADQKIVFGVGIADVIPFIRVKATVLTAGATPAQILTASILGNVSARRGR